MIYRKNHTKFNVSCSKSNHLRLQDCLLPPQRVSYHRKAPSRHSVQHFPFLRVVQQDHLATALFQFIWDLSSLFASSSGSDNPHHPGTLGAPHFWQLASRSEQKTKKRMSIGFVGLLDDSHWLVQDHCRQLHLFQRIRWCNIWVPLLKLKLCFSVFTMLLL